MKDLKTNVFYHNRIIKIILTISIVFFSVSILQSQIRIKMKMENGVYSTPCKVNGLQLRFIFDTGASNVSLSLTEAYFMLKNGYLDKSDLNGSSYSQIANGDIIENTSVTLREIEIGGLKLYNIEANIIHELDAPLLLGQSAIQKLGKIQLEGDELVILNVNKQPSFSSSHKSRTSFSKGVELYNSGRINDAILKFKEALIYDPKNAPASFNLGKIYHEIGKKDLSLSYYKDAIKFDPVDTNSIVSIGIIYFEYAVNDSAMKYFNMAIKKGPSFGLAYYNRGTLLAQLNYYSLSIDDLNKAALYSPDNSNIFMNRGLVHYYLKDMTSACKDWDKSANMGNSEAAKAVSIYCSPK